jgi:hypothetical protein
LVLLFYTEDGRGVKVNDRTRDRAGNPDSLFDYCRRIRCDFAEEAGYEAVNRKVPGERD